MHIGAGQRQGAARTAKPSARRRKSPVASIAPCAAPGLGRTPSRRASKRGPTRCPYLAAAPIRSHTQAVGATGGWDIAGQKKALEALEKARTNGGAQHRLTAPRQLSSQPAASL